MSMDELMRMLVLGTIVAIVATGAYVAFRYAMMWLRRYEQEGEMLAGQPTGTQVRLEALETHVAELQERLDFAERLLTRAGEPLQIEEHTPV